MNGDASSSTLRVSQASGGTATSSVRRGLSPSVRSVTKRTCACEHVGSGLSLGVPVVCKQQRVRGWRGWLCTGAAGHQARLHSCGRCQGSAVDRPKPVWSSSSRNSAPGSPPTKPANRCAPRSLAGTTPTPTRPRTGPRQATGGRGLTACAAPCRLDWPPDGALPACTQLRRENPRRGDKITA
jgi:hypothetical protein